MPLPSPTGGEDRDEFIDRCMSDNTMQDEFPDFQQRLAVCMRQWRDS